MIDEAMLTPAAVYAASVPVLVAVIQMFKSVSPATWWRFSPLVAAALGLVVAVGVAQGFPSLQEPWIVTGLKGLAVGLSAAGLFSSSRALGLPIPGPKANG